MRIVYAGTPEFALPALVALRANHYDVVAVYTQPDRPAGRGRKLTASPIKQWALEQGLPVEQPLSLKQPDAQTVLRSYAPDLLVVAAYGLILPQAVLDIPRQGCLNIHASLLPRWRGAAPIQRALLAGDPATGITLMQMQAGLDTGPMWAQADCPISAQDTAASLHDRLATLGADTLIAQLPAILAAESAPVPQLESAVTYAHKLEKSEAWLDWQQPAAQLDRQIRAFNPWPVAQTLWGDEVLRVWGATVLAGVVAHGRPGQVLATGADGIDVATGDGVLRLSAVQLPNKKVQSCREFLQAHVLAGAELGGVQ